MGHKVNPVGMRLGIVKPWESSWYADARTYRSYLLTDIEVREMLARRLAGASVSRIHIERKSVGNVCITVYSARPGIVIGKKGEGIEKLRADLAPMMGGPLQIKVEEVRKPELDAYLVAESVAQQIERRVMFRRAMKRAISNAMRIGAEGIKVAVSGRLNGAEIARSEWYREGRIPLHTLRADIDYSCVHARTTYGVIGVKVWILRDVLEDETAAKPAARPPAKGQAQAVTEPRPDRKAAQTDGGAAGSGRAGEARRQDGVRRNGKAASAEEAKDGDGARVREEGQAKDGDDARVREKGQAKDGDDARVREEGQAKDGDDARVREEGQAKDGITKEKSASAELDSDSAGSEPPEDEPS